MIRCLHYASKGADPWIFVRGVQLSGKKKNWQAKKKNGKKGRVRDFSIHSALVWSKSNLAIETAFQTVTFINMTSTGDSPDTKHIWHDCLSIVICAMVISWWRGLGSSLGIIWLKWWKNRAILDKINIEMHFHDSQVSCVWRSWRRDDPLSLEMFRIFQTFINL